MRGTKTFVLIFDPAFLAKTARGSKHRERSLCIPGLPYRGQDAMSSQGFASL